jgi:hypothetical protein
MNKYYKFLPLILVLSLLSAGLIYCGGGGDDGECTETFASGTYNFQLFLRSSDLTILIDNTDIVTVTDVFFNGTINTDTGEFTIDSTSTMDADTGSAFFGIFSADVTQTIRVPEGAEPTAGQIEVIIGSDKITVTINNSIPGVTVDLDTGNNGTVNDSVDVSWANFDFDNAGIPAFAQQAAFAFGSSGFILEQAELILEAAQVIDENELSFVPNVTFPITCDTFSPLTPPAGVTVDPGSADFTWSDSVSDGEINTGDNFSVELNQCWQNETADLDDTLLDGTLNLNSFFFGGADDSCRIISFGFDDVQYVNLNISDTSTDTVGGSVTIDTTLMVNGTFSLSLS